MVLSLIIFLFRLSSEILLKESLIFTVIRFLYWKELFSENFYLRANLSILSTLDIIASEKDACKPLCLEDACDPSFGGCCHFSSHSFWS